MNSKLISAVFVCILLSIQTLFAQEEPKIKFGAISMEDAQMKTYSLDSTAEAVVLYKRGDVRFQYDKYGHNDFQIVSNYHIRIKILKKSAFSRATITIPYYRIATGQEEFVDGIDGATYNVENGQLVKTKLTKESIFDEKPMDKLFQKKITFPAVKEGSIIEYRYEITSGMKVRDKPRTWYFQGDIPYKWSELNLSIPAYFYYKIMMGGYFPLYSNKNEVGSVDLGVPQISGMTNTLDYHFVMKDAPAFRDEPYITTTDDYISKIEFELSSVTFPGQGEKRYTQSWEDLDITLLDSDNFGRKIKRTGFLKEITAVFATKPDTLEKIKAAYQFMTSNFKSNDQNRVFLHDDLKKVYENRKGSATELNMLFLGMLREMDIEANPVILSTRSNGRIEENYALLDRFNYALVHVSIKGKDMLIDATNPYNKLGMIPFDCLNQRGRLIKKGGSRFVEIIPTDKYYEMEVVDVELDTKSGELRGQYSDVANGYLANALRASIIKDGKDEFLENIKKEHADWKITDLQIEDLDNIDKNVTTKFKFSSTDEDLDVDVLYLSPMLVGKLASNPFKSATRVYPVDFGRATEINYFATIKVPTGYSVAEFPKSIALSLPNNEGKFTFIAGVNDGRLQVNSKISIKKTIFYADEYEMLKKFYDKIVEKHAEQVVFKKN